MTDWWSDEHGNRWRDPVAVLEVPGPTSGPQEPPEEKTPKTEPEESGGRHRTAKLAAGALIVGLAGALVVNATSGSVPEPPAPATEQIQSDPFPPAGEFPAEDALEPPAASADPAPTFHDPAPQRVTLTARPAGRGRTGVVMHVAIENTTDAPILVMPSLLLGDDRPAIVGEGTLAPGSRTVEPGAKVEGTVEFAARRAPSRVVLTDLDGIAVAEDGGVR